MSQHTPGPWRTVCPPSSDIHKICYIFDQTDFKVAEVCQRESQGDALANAALIAAAPELERHLSQVILDCRARSFTTPAIEAAVQFLLGMGE